jgi:mycofactocin precursor
MSNDPTPSSPEPQNGNPDADPATLVEDVLVEEVSIDGMCGVY